LKKKIKFADKFLTFADNPHFYFL